MRMSHLVYKSVCRSVSSMKDSKRTAPDMSQSRRRKFMKSQLKCAAFFNANTVKPLLLLLLLLLPTTSTTTSSSTQPNRELLYLFHFLSINLHLHLRLPMRAVPVRQTLVRARVRRVRPCLLHGRRQQVSVLQSRSAKANWNDFRKRRSFEPLGDAIRTRRRVGKGPEAGGWAGTGP